MIEIKRHHIYLFFLVVGTICFYLFFFAKNDKFFSSMDGDRVEATGEKAINSRSSDDAQELALVDSGGATDLAFNRAFATTPEIATLAGTPSEAEVVRKWEESRGRFDEESLKDYAGYDVDTLSSLVNSGDVKAMIALARLYISDKHSEEFGINYSMPLLKRAAVYGSSYAMELYSIQLEADHFVKGTYDKSILLEVLSWNNAAALRGDLYPNHSATLDLRRKNIQLSQKDIEAIRSRSNDIYQQLLAERMGMGLGSFDDSVPDEVKKYFSFFDNYMNKN